LPCSPPYIKGSSPLNRFCLDLPDFLFFVFKFIKFDSYCY